ncbi:MAG TPA: hypothetical protein ENI98_00760 [Gammaproteobacteria bacterium]|nr:hypothetical protein [Gammaproteobacteria bacterium]
MSHSGNGPQRRTREKPGDYGYIFSNARRRFGNRSARGVTLVRADKGPIKIVNMLIRKMVVYYLVPNDVFEVLI